jgi:hypothetical protein
MSKITLTTPEGDRFRQVKAAAANNPLDGLTLAQALQYIEDNVTNFASAKTALKHLTKLVFVLYAQQEVERKRKG